MLDPETFASTRAALAAGDWLGARLALERVADADVVISDAQTAGFGSTTPDTVQQPGNESNTIALWSEFYAAKIALLRGDLDGHAAAVESLRFQQLPMQLRQALLQHQLENAQLSGDASAQLQYSLRLQSPSAGTEPESPAGNAVDTANLSESLTATSWTAAQHVSAEEAGALRQQGNEEIRGWLDLATANATNNPRDAAAALTAWQSQYPGHSASQHATALRDGALRDAQSAKMTLLLPLSGPLEKAGEALSQGFIAAYFADRNRELSLDVLDSRRYASIAEAYAEAQARGADIVVGPLGKREVEALLAQPDLPIPLLTLNRPESGSGSISKGSAGALQLSLAPEDEAAQLAEDAFASGARRALLIRPRGTWGDRMEAALATRWRAMGGQLPAQAIYDKPSAHSDTIRDALGLDASTARSAAVRALFSERVETLGRRREDLDVVFLLGKSSEEAQAIKPLVNYHYAGDLPVYALSTADSGAANTNLNRDLGGLRLLAMPWRLDEDRLPGSEDSEALGSAPALHALGADAYALARRWWRMRSAAAPSYRGLTAELRPTMNGSLERRLKLAEFDRGALLPR
jgi:outer membrane PBP1 activator LpoA protein